MSKGIELDSDAPLPYQLAQILAERPAWAAGVHASQSGALLGVGYGQTHLAFVRWYEDQAQHAVMWQGCVLVIYRHGSASETISARNL